MRNPLLGKVPTPLELGDTVADVANQVACTPLRVVGNMTEAASRMAKNLEADMARPREYAEIPPPPDVLIEPVFSGVSHIVQGVMGVVKGGIDGVVETVEGIRREVDTLVRR